MLNVINTDNVIIQINASIVSDKMYINATLYAENEYNDVVNVESVQYLSLQREYRLPETQGRKVRPHLTLIIKNTIPPISFDLVISKRGEKIFYFDCKVIGRDMRESRRKSPEGCIRRCSSKKAFLNICNFIKKETLTQVFSYQYCEIFKNSFFLEHIQWLLLNSFKFY